MCIKVVFGSSSGLLTSCSMDIVARLWPLYMYLCKYSTELQHGSDRDCNLEVDVCIVFGREIGVVQNYIAICKLIARSDKPDFIISRTPSVQVAVSNIRSTSIQPIS